MCSQKLTEFAILFDVMSRFRGEAATNSERIVDQHQPA